MDPNRRPSMTCGRDWYYLSCADMTAESSRSLVASPCNPGRFGKHNCFRLWSPFKNTIVLAHGARLVCPIGAFNGSNDTPSVSLRLRDARAALAQAFGRMRVALHD